MCVSASWGAEAVSGCLTQSSSSFRSFNRGWISGDWKSEEPVRDSGWLLTSIWSFVLFGSVEEDLQVTEEKVDLVVKGTESQCIFNIFSNQTKPNLSVRSLLLLNAPTHRFLDWRDISPQAPGVMQYRWTRPLWLNMLLSNASVCCRWTSADNGRHRGIIMLMKFASFHDRLSCFHLRSRFSSLFRSKR